MATRLVSSDPTPQLQRHFGLLQAAALNVTMIVGAGVFVTIPLMLKQLPGPYALLGWLAGALLMLADGMIWSELGAALPSSGGSYVYLLECFGRARWGRLMAFLFIWQFLISGPLEIASGLIAINQFAAGLDDDWAALNERYTWTATWGEWEGKPLTVSAGPSRLAVFGLGLFLIFLLHHRMDNLGRLTVTFLLGILAVIAWIVVEGALRFRPEIAFDPPGPADWEDKNLALGLGGAMILAMYSYFGYYNVCYIGEEVRDPGKTIPRSIFLSSLLVCFLFAGLHLAMLGTVSWRNPTDNLASAFMKEVHGSWAVRLVAVLLIWSCTGAAFAALLGYSRVPYGAARYGHFFAVLGRVHPVHRIPNVALFTVGGLTLFWSFFDLESVISALITTRILQQFIGQIIGVIVLRRTQPKLYRPYRIWLYPLPCLLALVGWLYLYIAAGALYMVVGSVTVLVGAVVFLFRAWATQTWPFC